MLLDYLVQWKGREGKGREEKKKVGKGRERERREKKGKEKKKEWGKESISFSVFGYEEKQKVKM